MYTLTREQRISNLQEILSAKKEKLVHLQTEVENLERKLSKLQTTDPRSAEAARLAEQQLEAIRTSVGSN